MKIALIIEHFDPTRGGAEHFTHWLALQLAHANHEVHVICHDVSAKVNRYRQATQRASHDADRSHQAAGGGSGSNPAEDSLPPGIHIHRLRGIKLNSALGFRRFGNRAKKLLQKISPDIAHSMTIACPADIYQPHAGIYAEIQRQAIASRHSPAAAQWKKIFLSLSAKQRTLLALERRAFNPTAKTPRKIISLCPMMTHQIQSIYHTPPEKILDLPNPRMTPLKSIDATQSATDRTWFRQHYKLAPDDRVALFVGHDFRRKGLRYAIETIAKTPDWKLLVVGLGKAREYVDLANNLHIGDINPSNNNPRILFVGPTRDMDRLYPAADALLLPTFYDSFGLVVLEAFSHGLPAISTEFLGASYLIKNSQAGAIVPTPRHTEEMAAALENLPKPNTPAQAALSARARAASLSMPPETYLQKLLALYQDLQPKPFHRS